MTLPTWTPGLALFIASLAIALLVGNALARREAGRSLEQERRHRQLRALREVETLTPVIPDRMPDGREWP